MTKKKTQNATPAEIAEAITGFPCTVCAEKGEQVWLDENGECPTCSTEHCWECGVRLGVYCEHQPDYCTSDQCEGFRVELDEDGSCPECGYTPCPYCGGFDCVHVVAIAFDEEWGTRPWPNEQFDVPGEEDVDWENPGLVEEISAFLDGSYVNELAYDGLSYEMERELWIACDRTTDQESHSMGGSGAVYYFAKDPERANLLNAAHAEEFQALLDSLPEKYPPVGEEEEDDEEEEEEEEE